MFLDGVAARRQLIVEIGGRFRTSSRNRTALVNRNAGALSVRFQQAIGQRMMVQVDGFGSVQESRGAGWGARLEWRLAF